MADKIVLEAEVKSNIGKTRTKSSRRKSKRV